MMRLVAWNTNYNCNRRSLEENVRLLGPLNADLLVLSEAAAPGADNPLGAHWIGDRRPGLAVVAPTGLKLIPHPANADAPTLVGAFTASGRIAFDLLAVWAVKQTGGPSYHDILTAGLERYGGLLRSSRAIMAGDFNSSTYVSGQEFTHPQFVKRAESLGLVSAYHEQTGERHGEETVTTYLHNFEANMGFHIDYCFVAKSLMGSVKLCVLNDAEWAGRSDHYPLVLDVSNKALMG